VVRLRYAGQNDMRRSSNGYGYNGKHAAGEDIRESMSYPIYQALRSANQTLTDIAASAPMGRLNVIVDGKAELATSFLVSGNYFQLLNVPGWIGRTLSADDDNPSAPAVAVISYGYWQKRFGGSTAVLGKAISMNNAPITIVGVLPQEFTGIQILEDPSRNYDVTLPLALDPQLNPQQNSG